jgi:hypothetical protein
MNLGVAPDGGQRVAPTEVPGAAPGPSQTLTGGSRTANYASRCAERGKDRRRVAVVKTSAHSPT